MGNIYVNFWISVSGEDVFSYSSGGHFVQWSKAICSILAEGIMGNSHVGSFKIWTSGSGDIV